MSVEADHHSLVYEWLEKAENDQLLGGGKRRYALLRYLLREELEGRGESLKAYAVAIDVLGRPEDFDPATDSIVRVEVARLRDALELHYARSSDESELRITIPKGGYRPKVEHPTVAEKDTSDRRTGSWFSTIRIMVVPLVFFSALTLSWLAFSSAKKSQLETDVPIIEVTPLSLQANSENYSFAVGFRQHLIADLSHLPTVIVRDGPVRPDVIRSGKTTAPTYKLDVVPVFQGNTGLIGLQLVSVENEVIVWAKTLAVSQNIENFYDSMVRAVLGIGQEIAGPSGAITLRQAETLVQTHSTESGASDAEYNCLVISLIADATKDDDAQAVSRNCLKSAISRGTENATLLSAYALDLFFQSSTATERTERRILLEEAEKAARRAIRNKPLDSFAHEVLGNVLSVLDDHSGAIKHYSRAVEIAPSRPAPHFLLGWQQALLGDWENGVTAMQEGIDMQPTVPGYMIVPLALDAFRRSDYELSLARAKEIIGRGDRRGYSLAFAASLALGDREQANNYFFHPEARTSQDPSDPMREVRVTFSNPDVMPKYEKIVEPYLNQIQGQ